MKTFNPPTPYTKLHLLHARVTEHCIRRPHTRGKTVGIDALLVTPEISHAAAIYWASPRDGLKADRTEELYEIFFALGDDGKLTECVVPPEWERFTWLVYPDGVLHL